MLKISLISNAKAGKWQWVNFFRLQKPTDDESAAFELARIEHQKASQVDYCMYYNIHHPATFRIRTERTSENGSRSGETNCFIDLMQVFSRLDGTLEVKPITLRRCLVKGINLNLSKLYNFLILNRDIRNWSSGVMQSFIKVKKNKGMFA